MSVYMNPIANGITVSLLIIYLAFIPALIYQYRKYGAFRLRKNVVLTSFIVYMITAFFMTLLPLPSIEAVKSMEPIKANFHPFLFVKTFLNDSGFIWNDLSTWSGAICSSSFYTVAFNFLLTVPFGVYLRKYFKQHLLNVAISGFLLSIFYEMTQFTGLYGIYPHAFRYADVDDLIVNTIGAILGFFVGGILNKWLPDPTKDRTLHTKQASLLRRLFSVFIDTIFIKVLYELLRIIVFVFMENNKQELLELVLYMLSFGIIFILLPLVLKKKRTLGMFILNLSFKDKNGNVPKSLGIILHNLFIGLWLTFTPNVIGTVLNNGIIIILQLIVFGLFIVMIITSIKNKKITYFWENIFDTYIKVE